MLRKLLQSEFAAWRILLVQPVSWLLLIVALYVFLAANVDFAAHLTWHDGQRIAQLVLLGLFLATFVLPGVGSSVVVSWKLIPSWSRAAMIAMFTLGVGSAWQAELRRWAFLEWGMLLLLLFVVLGVAAGMRAGRQSLSRLLVLVFYATAVAYTVKAIVVYLTMLTVGTSYGMWFDVREMFTGFSNIRFFGHIQTMLLPFLLLPALCWGITLRQRFLLNVVPVLWWMLVAASGTRGTWIALLAGALAVIAFGGRSGIKWLKWQIVGLACGLVCYGLFVLLIPTLLDLPVSFLHRTQDITTLSLREVIWSTALVFTRDNPLLGVGPMHFAYHENAVAAHPHSIILQFMAEWGIPAAFLFTVATAGAWLAFAGRVRQFSGQGNEFEQMIRIALLAALTGAAAQAMVDGVMVMPVSQMLLMMLCGWALGLSPPGAGITPIASRGNLVSLAFVAVVAATTVVYGVVPEIGRLAEREEAYLASRVPKPFLLPRFWALGWIAR